MWRQLKRGSGGFTMVEVIVVVIIIGVLAAMIATPFLGRVGKAKQTVAGQKIKVIEEAIEMFRLDCERYPQGLEELLTRPGDIPEEKWSPPSVKRKDLIDPWDREFVYRYPGDHGTFDLLSFGADGQEGGEGENADVVNW